MFTAQVSHPSWVCGLKLLLHCRNIRRYKVTPFVGVWIETVNPLKSLLYAAVTPFVGVWIETTGDVLLGFKGKVTPFVGVWIETGIR